MVLPRGFAPRLPGHQPGVLLVGRQEEKWRKTEDMLPRPIGGPIRVPGGPGSLVRFIFQKSGCLGWIRTIIVGFRVRHPTVGRQGNGGPGGSRNLTNVRLKVGCRSSVASGPLWKNWSLRQDLHPHCPRSRRGASSYWATQGMVPERGIEPRKHAYETCRDASPLRDL